MSTFVFIREGNYWILGFWVNIVCRRRDYETMSKPNLPTFTFLSTNKLFFKFKIPELPTLIFFNMKIWKLKKYLVKMQVHKSKNAQYFNLLSLTSTQGSNYFCRSNLTLRFLVYILVLIFQIYILYDRKLFLLLQEQLKKLKTPQPTLKKVGYNNYKTGT